MSKRTIAILALSTLSLALLFFVVRTCHANTDPAIPIKLYAGYSRVIINPDLSQGGVPLAGYGNNQYRLATADGQTYKQDLAATAVAIKDDEGGQHIFVTVDNIGASKSWVSTIIDRVTAETNIPAESITISGTHTHSAPDTASSMPTITNYINNILVPQIVNAIEAAVADATHETEIYTGSVNVGGNTPSEYMNFVRHYKTDSYDLSGKMVISGDNHGGYVLGTDGLLKSTRIKGFEGQGHVREADREMQFIRLKMSDADDILMVNWQAHPTVTGSRTFATISADFIASFREKVEQERHCRVAYYTGAAGDLNTVTRIDDGSEGTAGLNYSRDTSSPQTKYETSVAYGNKLAQNAIQMYDNLTKSESGYVRNARQTLTLNQTKIDSTNEANIPLIRNAYFVRTIYTATNQEVVDIIRGTYSYDLAYGFPDGFDSNGAGLRDFISKYSSLRNAFFVSVDGTVSDSLTAESITRSDIHTLATMVGYSLSPQLDSPYAANAVVNRSSSTRENTRTIEINAVSIGDISFTASPNEIFSENGKYMKNKTHSRLNFVLEKTNGSESYMPSTEAYDYGCYEADTTNFAKGSAETVAQTLANSVNNLRQFTVTTHHYYDGSIEQIAPDETSTYEFGEGYETRSVNSERYELVSNPEYASGVVNKDLEITYYYVDKHTDGGGVPETSGSETAEVPDTGEFTNKNSAQTSNIILYPAFLIVGALLYQLFRRLKNRSKVLKF